jgi:lysophospholipid acyltransferase (LPLAT)-like uncharacterized protein
MTYRYRFVGIENLEKATQMNPGRGYLLGIWHQNLFQGILAQTGLKYVVIVSRSKDANPVAYTCTSLGHIVTRGSSKKGNVDKGGKAAKNEMISVLQQGYPGAVTIDGPKGPAKEVKPGIIDMAKKSGSPIVPYIPVPEKYWSFNSWDKFRLPKPFSKIVVYYGSPIMVPSDCDNFEEYQTKLKTSLDQDELLAHQKFMFWDQLSKKNIENQVLATVLTTASSK